MKAKEKRRVRYSTSDGFEVLGLVNDFDNLYAWIVGLSKEDLRSVVKRVRRRQRSVEGEVPEEREKRFWELVEEMVLLVSGGDRG